MAIDNVAELWRVYEDRSRHPSEVVWIHVADVVFPFRFTVRRR